MPFNVINKNSVVIMDNCSIHHIHEVTSTIRETGAISHFLSPYSPDYNPIAEAFSKVKIVMKSMEVEMQALDDIDIHAAFSSISPDDCKAWIKQSGIYNL